MTKVGYKNPLQHTRFKKGVSGNPKGRPRGKPAAKTASQRLDEALARRVTVKTSAGAQRMSALDLLIANLIQQAAKGDKAARKDLLGLLKLRGDFTPLPRRDTVGVVVVERPCASVEDWLEQAEQTRLPLDPLEGLPGVIPGELKRLPSRAPPISPEEDDD